MAKTKDKTLAELAKELAPPKPKCWVDSLPKDEASELLELRVAYHRGEFSVSSTAIYRSLVAKRFGDVVSESTFTKWMAKK